jgi:hypothetical protein
MVLATSGLTGDGVVEGIDWVAQSIVRNIHVRQGGGIHAPRTHAVCAFTTSGYFGSGSRHFLLNPYLSGFRVQTKIFYGKIFYKFTNLKFFFSSKTVI